MAIAKLDIAHSAPAHGWLSEIASFFSFSAKRGDESLGDAVAQLENMSDRELADIGIGRGEIRSAVYGLR